MSEIAFSKRSLEQILPRKARFRIKDEGHRESVTGLVLEVMPSGSKYYRYRRCQNGKDLHVTIGQFPQLSVENARKKAKQLALQVMDGVDPNEVKRHQLAEAERPKVLSLSMQQLFDIYVAEFELKIKSGERREKSLKDSKSNWNTHLKHRVGRLQANDIDRAYAHNLLKLILIERTPSVHNKCLTILKSMFAESEANPFAKVKKVASIKRERILNQDEMQALMASLEQEPAIYQDVVMMLLLTGQRKSCVFSMEWQEVDHANAVWLIPTTKMKAKRPHAVPLVDKAMEILKRRSEQAEAGQTFVFPSQQTQSGHVVDKSGASGFWNRISNRAGLYSSDRSKNVTIHDLRRTIASWNVMRGGSLQAASKLLGHSDISITASTYAHLQLEQVRAELDSVTGAIVDGQKQAQADVVPAQGLDSLT
ncbi:tyrosine-type recombinase/integrase [Ferrimonas lipolytica]|uniref:Tyrosine-type recombinase/integrase n=1 Tax=Ferrimonas lipolytica TaxID=2724191 RepID=A0A6H1UEL5_9GAMM|nr:site-specific integrase [Ferrimonas lipolytica]QIZ77268.1 tyrosine-type recombinase/integrase [Ferrimonas lipolytica]